MITVKRRFRFCCAHRLLGYEGKCSQLHGHNYEAVVHVQMQKEELDALGMLIDFGKLKVLGEWIDKHWDHALLLHSDDPLAVEPSFDFDVNPTAEVMAYTLLHCDNLLPDGYTIVKVELWETPDCSVEVTR